MAKIYMNKHPLFSKEQIRAGIFNRLTSFLRKSPDFMLIGSPKCGSTSLEYYITQHPNVARLKRKELAYFDWEFANGYGWYLSFFPLKWDKRIAGDFSPSYLNQPTVVKKIKKRYPQMKFIITLRNPIDRSFSDYNMHHRRGYDKLSFAEAIEQENNRLEGEIEKIITDKNYRSYNFNHYGYVQKGLYYDFIKNWFEFYPKENFLIINFDEDFKDLPNLMNKIFNFLNLQPYDKINFEKQNVGKYENIDPILRKKLYEHFKPYNEKLYSLLGRDFGWN